VLDTVRGHHRGDFLHVEVRGGSLDIGRHHVGDLQLRDIPAVSDGIENVCTADNRSRRVPHDQCADVLLAHPLCRFHYRCVLRDRLQGR